MSNIKLGDLLRCFNGEGDVIQWITKVELVLKIKEVKDVCAIIPMFLEGPAFAVYNELSAEDKGNGDAIKNALICAFATNPFLAYEEFVRRTWRDEPVDVYMTDLRRLARLAGVTSDALLMKAFIVGLPSVVSRELRAQPKVETMPLSTIMERARALMAELVDQPVVAVAQGRQKFVATSPNARRRCFKCGGPHMVKFCCEQLKSVCWNCGKDGHLARHCEKGNGSRRTGAPAALLNQD